MKIHVMKEKCLNTLKANVAVNIEHYNDPTNEWIYDYLGEDPFKEYKIEIDNPHLDGRRGAVLDMSKNDVSNAIRLYNAMSRVSESDAMDERLWAGLTHGDFWGYMHERFVGSLSTSKNEIDTIHNRYFFKEKRLHNAIFRNSLSRLWWLCKVTKDDTREDVFELTRYLENDFTGKIVYGFASNFISNPSICHGYIDALMELEREGARYDNNKRKVMTTASNFLNNIGGTYILDCFTEEEIKEKILRYIKSRPEVTYVPALKD